MMENRFYYKRNGKIVLEDGDISNAICSAQMDFADGAIVECMDTLTNILYALKEFTKQESGDTGRSEK